MIVFHVGPDAAAIGGRRWVRREIRTREVTVDPYPSRGTGPKRFDIGAKTTHHMARGEELRTAADALDESILVYGIENGTEARWRETFPRARFASVSEPCGGLVVDGTDPVTVDDVTHRDDATQPDDVTHRDDATQSSPVLDPVGVTAAVVIDPVTNEDRLAGLRALAATDVFTIAVVPGGVCESDAPETIAEEADGVVVAGDGDGSALGAVDAVSELLTIVRDPGFVNLDLTDARTVLSSGPAAVATGTAPHNVPGVAVESAFDRLPAGVDAGSASAVLVEVVVDPDTSIAAATDAIGEVRDRVAPDANVIWGGAVNDDAVGVLLVRVVVADVRYDPPLAAGDPCPRCGSSLSSYRFGASETLSCDACGYSGIGMCRN